MNLVSFLMNSMNTPESFTRTSVGHGQTIAISRAGSMRKSLFVQSCLFLFIALSPVQDFFLQGTPLRSVGASISFFPLLALAFCSFAEWLQAGHFKLKRNHLFCLVYMLLTSVYGLLVFGTASHGENLLWKGLTSFISLALFLFGFAGINYRLSSALRPAIYAAFFLMLLGFCFSASNPFGLPSFLETSLLHWVPASGGRPRGLASEPSELSITVIALGLLSVYVTHGRIARIVFFAATIALLVASGSKGGILTLFICAIIFCLVKWHSRWYHVPILLFILLPLGLFLVFLIPNLFPEESIASSGTIPTRASMILCSLITLLHHPFGVGFTGFLPAVTSYLPDAMSSIQSISPVPLYFGEVSEYLVSSDMVSTKTFFFDQLMRFGLPFALGFVVIIVNTLRRLAAANQIVLFFAILACAISITTYMTTMGTYTVAILFGVAFGEINNGTHPDRGE